jgi:putative membrane-bound dehydrogenase-like protein
MTHRSNPRLPNRSIRRNIGFAMAAVCAALWTVAAGPTSTIALGGEAITWQTKRLDGAFTSEGATAADIDGDGALDVIAGPYWYQGPTFEKRLALCPPADVDPHGYSNKFFSFSDDFNRDGRPDILVVGFPGEEAYWWENTGQFDRPWPQHTVLDIVDNESPQYVDITGDGKRELLCMREGFYGYATPDPSNPTAPWSFHKVSDQTGGGRYTHGIGYGDVNGDGRAELLEQGGYWLQPESLEGDPTWQKMAIPLSSGGSHMLTRDFDGDGDQDIVTSLEAHGYGVAWYEQFDDGGKVGFRKHLIAGTHPQESPYGIVFSQPHALAVGDIDGDGIDDIVTGKRPWAHGPHGDPEPNGRAVLYWFRTTHDTTAIDPVDGERLPVAFEPNLIHPDSGVGVDVQLHDLDRDGRLDIVVGNKRGVWVHWQRRTPAADEGLALQRPRDRSKAAKALPNEQRPSEGLAPLDAASQMTVPEGFAVDLIAGEPNLHQPVAFCFDPRGRIWVAEAHTYPNRAAEGEGKDCILVLEDRDRDGSFESKQVFAEKLNLVSGLQVGHGGVWVGAAPNLLFIPDRDANGVADAKPEVVLDGWGFDDTHETLNSLTWGPDGWLYGCHGVFTHSRVGVPGTPDPQRTPINAGLWRWHPQRKTFEVFAHGTSNPWGIGWDEHGEAFFTACVIPHAYHVIQGGRYIRQAGQHFDPYAFASLDTIADHKHYAGEIGDHAWWGRDAAVEDDATSAAGGGHAHCGTLVYLGDSFPETYRGRLLTCNIHGNRINSEVLRASGSTFIASHDDDLLFANDPWFRGIALQLGPDGNVYFCDWYDQHACHRTQQEIWDRTTGRLYRLSYNGHLTTHVNVAEADDRGLVRLLSDRNDWNAQMARRLLAERTAAGTLKDKPAILGMLDAMTDDSTLPSPTRLQALWARHGIEPIADTRAMVLLESSDEWVRVWGIRLALEDRQASPSLRERLVQQAIHDGAWTVQLALCSGLQRLPTDERWELAEALVGRSDNQHDKAIPAVLWYGVEPLVSANASRGVELASRCKIPAIQQWIDRRLAFDPNGFGTLVEAIASADSDDRARSMLAALHEAAPRLGKQPMPSRWPAVTKRFASVSDGELPGQLQTLAVLFGDRAIFPTMREIVRDGTQDSAKRLNAWQLLLQGKDDQLGELAITLLDDAKLRSRAIDALTRVEEKGAAAAILQRYAGWNAAERGMAIDALVARRSYANSLIDAIALGTIPRQDLTAVHVSKLQQLEDPAIIDRIREVWGTVRTGGKDLTEALASYRMLATPSRLADADPRQGRKLYAKVCGQCHVLYGEGIKIGPELTGANRGSLDYLLENILDPNALVGKDYQTITIVTVDGRSINGLVHEDTPAAIILHDSKQLVTIPRGEIEEVSTTSLSLMPEGLLQPLSEQERVDLLRYLQSTAQVPLDEQAPAIGADGFVIGAIEGERLSYEVSGGSVDMQPMSPFKQGHWSGDGQLWWRDGAIDSTLKVTFELAQSGRQELYAGLTQASDYGQVRIRVDGDPTGVVVDGYVKEGVLHQVVSLGNFDLQAGTHVIEVTVVGNHPDAIPRQMFGLDYLYATSAR